MIINNTKMTHSLFSVVLNEEISFLDLIKKINSSLKTSIEIKNKDGRLLGISTYGIYKLTVFDKYDDLLEIEDDNYTIDFITTKIGDNNLHKETEGIRCFLVKSNVSWLFFQYSANKEGVNYIIRYYPSGEVTIMEC